MTKESEYVELPGRSIDDVPYTGLVESMVAISLICSVVAEAKYNLNEKDLHDLFGQISNEAAKMMVFSCASPEELKKMNDHMMKAMYRVQ